MSHIDEEVLGRYFTEYVNERLMTNAANTMAVLVSDELHIVGALGAALYAL